MFEVWMRKKITKKNMWKKDERIWEPEKRIFVVVVVWWLFVHEARSEAITRNYTFCTAYKIFTNQNFLHVGDGDDDDDNDKTI